MTLRSVLIDDSIRLLEFICSKYWFIIAIGRELSSNLQASQTLKITNELLIKQSQISARLQLFLYQYFEGFPIYLLFDSFCANISPVFWKAFKKLANVLQFFVRYLALLDSAQELF